MKRYLINSRVLINVMKLRSPSKSLVPSGDRCLKLGALRCLRSIISLKDEFYNRHIVQHSLFTPVFEAFRANPVGDNLVSSSIIGKCSLFKSIILLHTFISLIFLFHRNVRVHTNREYQISY